MNEEERVIKNIDGERPDDSVISYIVKPISEPDKYLDKVKEVMSCISKFNSDNWLSDDQWEKQLPKWFIQELKKYSLEEIIQNQNLWTYGSWLDAMKFRAWNWWSSCLIEEGFEIILTVYSQPYIIDPLEYILFASGINKCAIKFVDL